MEPLRSFNEIWAVDFEFTAPPGQLPQPVCLVACELRTGRCVRVWKDELLRMEAPPYSTSSSSLFVAYYASAEIGCHLALGWEVPERVIDLYVEFRVATNGTTLPSGRGLLGALVAHGLEAIGVHEKIEMRDLVMSGGPWSAAEQGAILDYCESDVIALAKLLPAMAPTIDLPRALCRGRYMAAVARMERAGTPIDRGTYDQLQTHWADIKDELVAKIDLNYQVYEGTSFRQVKFAEYLATHNIPWPHLPSGRLDLSDAAFKDQAKIYPELTALRTLRQTLSQMRS